MTVSKVLYVKRVCDGFDVTMKVIITSIAVDAGDENEIRSIASETRAGDDDVSVRASLLGEPFASHKFGIPCWIITCRDCYYHCSKHSTILVSSNERAPSRGDFCQLERVDSRPVREISKQQRADPPLIEKPSTSPPGTSRHIDNRSSLHRNKTTKHYPLHL